MKGIQRVLVYTVQVTKFASVILVYDWQFLHKIQRIVLFMC